MQMQVRMADEKISTPGLLTVEEYAKMKNKNESTIYRHIKTQETPDGKIEAVMENGRWMIDWEKHKDLKFKNRTVRKLTDEKSN